MCVCVFFFFFFLGGGGAGGSVEEREDPNKHRYNWAITCPPAKCHLAFRWRADDGRLGSFVFSDDSD